MTNSTHARITAFALVLGPVLFTLGDLLRRLVEPSATASATDLTGAVGRHGGVWLCAGLLGLIAAPLLTIAMAGLVATARGRGGRVTITGALLVGVGAIALVGHAVAFYAPYALYDRAGTARAALEALDRASESYPLLTVLVIAFVVGMALGPVVLFVGLRRARRVPIWSLVAAVVFVACGSTSGVGAGILGIAAALAAFVPAAKAVTAAATGSRRDTATTPVVAPS